MAVNHTSYEDGLREGRLRGIEETVVKHGDRLDKHGYLVDIIDIENNLNALVAYYKDKTLNELPEFAGLNPSIEHFCRIFCEGLAERIKAETLTSMAVQIWENEIAWASYRLLLK